MARQSVEDFDKAEQAEAPAPEAPQNPFDRKKQPAQWRLWERRNADRIKREEARQSTDGAQ